MHSPLGTAATRSGRPLPTSLSSDSPHPEQADEEECIQDVGWDIARKIVINPAGSGGWVLDGYGGVHRFSVLGQAAPPVITNLHYPNPEAVTPPWWATGSLVTGFGSTVLLGEDGCVEDERWPSRDIARAFVLPDVSRGSRCGGEAGARRSFCLPPVPRTGRNTG